MADESAGEMFKIYAKYALLSAVPIFTALVAGLGPVNDLATAKAAGMSLAIGVGTGVARAIYGAVRSGELPFPRFGL